jgi:hypothetical protein
LQTKPSWSPEILFQNRSFVDEDEHPLDAPLGVIHEAALKLELLGLTELALAIAQAHDDIQDWALTTINSKDG